MRQRWLSRWVNHSSAVVDAILFAVIGALLCYHLDRGVRLTAWAASSPRSTATSPRRRSTAPRAGPAVVTPKRKPAIPADTKKAEPAPAVVRKAKPGNDNRPDPAPLPTDGKRSAIVTVKRKGRFGDVPDMTPGSSSVAAMPRRNLACRPGSVGRLASLAQRSSDQSKLELDAPAPWRCGISYWSLCYPRREHCPFIKTKREDVLTKRERSQSWASENGLRLRILSQAGITLSRLLRDSPSWRGR